MFGYQSILKRLDIEIATAGARELELTVVELSEEDFADFCRAVGHKQRRFSPWPKYRGLIIKRKKK